MLRFHLCLALVSLLLLTSLSLAVEAIEQDSKFTAVAQRFQADFGLSLKLAQVDDPSFAKNYVVTALKPEHLDHALQILTWM